MSLPPSYQELVDTARKGDERAMEQLLVLMRPHMEMIARSYSDPSQAFESASDIVQEAGVRAWQKFDQFQGGHTDEETLSMLRSWVGQIVRRLALNAQRDRKRERRQPAGGAILSLQGAAAVDSSAGPGIDPCADGPTPSAVVRLDEVTGMVEAALDKISDPSDRLILRLRFFEGSSLRQISQRLDISYDNVRGRYEASLRRLEKELESLV